MGKVAEIFPAFLHDIKSKRSLRVLGIDLGTTNSVVADLKWDPNQPEEIKAACIEIPQETMEGYQVHWLVPSVVALDDGRLFIGEGAKRLRSRLKDFGLEQNKNIFYECKNDMGVRRTYHKAPEGFQSAREIGGKILYFLYKSALDCDPTPVDRVVVTVPASFQAAQRHDTLDAARLAGLHLLGGDLLDEPVAAFLDYLVEIADDSLLEAGETKHVLVFDFGGGTCDVAVFRIGFSEDDRSFDIASLAVSRYHRLGGGDIDRAIIYKFLIPQVMEQNRIPEFSLNFTDKKNYLEPALLGVAESLKIKMSMEIRRLQEFGHYQGADLDQVAVKYPGIVSCPTKTEEFEFKNPTLTARQFEEVLAPFLDRDLLYFRENEYHLTCSIFAPLQDALDRSGLLPSEIDYCLLVGGSSLIPQMRSAISEYFPESRLLVYQDLVESQIAVARGAAYHALSLALFGKGFFRPVCHDAISIRTKSGLIELIPKGAKLPYPGSGFALLKELAVPEEGGLGKPVDLRIDIVAGEDQRLLLSKIWRIEGNVRGGEPLCLEYRYDENQILSLLMSLADLDDTQVFEERLERPLTNVVNPNATRQRILEMEEEMRTGNLPRRVLAERMVEVAELYAELKQYEKALEMLRRALKAKQRPDAVILNLMGIYSGRIGDFEREEKFYKEAAAVSDWDGPLFNLVLAYWRRNKIDDAIAVADNAMQSFRSGPLLVLRAKLAWEKNCIDEGKKYLEEAFRIFDPLDELDDWELTWYLNGAGMLKDQERIAAANAEQQKRRIKVKDEGGVLPEVKGKGREG